MRGIMKNSPRKEENWNRITFKEPYKKATDRFREEVLSRPDFDPATLFQFAIFMAKGLVQMLEDVEENFGPEGQKVCNEALIKVGKDMGKQMFEGFEIPQGMSLIELVSFIGTIFNTVSWSSIEEPQIIDNENCEFDIIWCPLEDEYTAFDCRIQRYLVQGILDLLREMYPFADFNLEFVRSIPAGGETCKFRMTRRKRGAPDKWEFYSKILENRALKRWKAKQAEQNSENNE